MTPAPAVPMTADVEAVARWMYDEAHAVRNVGTRLDNMAAYLRRHWPQPVSGQITGEALRDAYLSEYRKEFSSRLTVVPWPDEDPRMVSVWSRAAARLAAPQGVGFDVEAVASRRLTAWEKYIGQRAWDASREQAHDTTFREWLTMNHPNDQHMIPNEEVVASCRDGMCYADTMVAQSEAAAVQVGMSAYKTGFRDGEKAAQKAMDADALAQEIMAYVYPPSGDLPATKANIAAILRRHTPSVSAGRAVVPAFVEVTADDLAEICEADEFTTWEDNAATLNARLRARAGTAGVQWVKRPIGTLATIADPRDSNSDAVRLFCETVNGDRFVTTAGQWPPQRECARWSADGVTWHRRTAATAGGWTARDVEACVGQRVATIDGDGDEGIRRFRHNGAEQIALMFNEDHVTAYYILPPVEAQP